MVKMRQLNRLTVLVPLLILAACGSPTIPTISTVDGVPTAATNATPPRYILCSLDTVIKYAAPKAGQVDSAANEFDRATTIGADAPNAPARGTIRYHNQVYRAACGN
jgi:hypothetical protein